jgi:hypothetical protein
MTCAIFELPDGLFQRCYPEPDAGIVRMRMAPEMFLRLAAPMPTPAALFDPAQVAAWDDCPCLMIDPEARQVIGHEGRHRMQALRAAGFTDVEIVLEITPDPCRFPDFDALLAWEWDGQLPPLDALQPETVWREAVCS